MRKYSIYIVVSKWSIMDWEINISGGGKGKLQSEQYIPHKERETGEEERERERCMKWWVGVERENERERVRERVTERVNY